MKQVTEICKTRYHILSKKSRFLLGQNVQKATKNTMSFFIYGSSNTPKSSSKTLIDKGLSIEHFKTVCLSPISWTYRLFLGTNDAFWVIDHTRSDHRFGLHRGTTYSGVGRDSGDQALRIQIIRGELGIFLQWCWIQCIIAIKDKNFHLEKRVLFISLWKFIWNCVKG